MATSTIIKEKGHDSVVYDISLDGTFVNALGMNILHNTDGFNFEQPKKFRYTDEHPYIAKGTNFKTVEGKAYTELEGDNAEFNERYFGQSFSPLGYRKMAVDIDEIVAATVNFSKKNYADYFPENPYPNDVKMVGNTIKSKKMPEYIAKFIAVGIRQLLRGEGQKFIESYYEYIEKIYNGRIALRDIATKGKVKRSIPQYLDDMRTLTKAGRPKSRQAWYELAIKEGLDIKNGETLYYINTGTSKSHTDVKKVTTYLKGMENVTREIEKEYKAFNKTQKGLPKSRVLTKQQWLDKYHSDVTVEEEFQLRCKLVPRWVIDSDDDVYCSDLEGTKDEIVYNIPKYISMFNNRIKPLLVCFSRSIRGEILVTDPDDKRYFTEEQCRLVSGEPNNPSDQDTYEDLMTMDDREIRFWISVDKVPPFLEECKMGKWEDIVADYNERMEKERELGIDKEKEALREAMEAVTGPEMDDFNEEGVIPAGILKVATLDPQTFKLMSKNYPDIVLAPLSELNDVWENKLDTDML